MVQSQQVLEWMAQGAAEGKADALIRLLELRFQSVPPEIVTAIRGTSDLGQLTRWFDLAATSATLDDFRQAANL